MKTLLNILGVVSIASALLGTINLITLLVFRWDLCFYTFSPVTELGGTTLTTVVIVIPLSFVLGFAWLGNKR